MSQVLWEMHGTIMCAAMLEEQRIRGDRSIVAYTGLLLSTGWTRFVRQANKKLVKRVIKQTNDLELWTVGVYGKRDKLRTKKERLSSCNKVFLESCIAIEKVYIFSVFLASL